MYQKNKFDLPFCGLTMKLFPTGNTSPKFEFSGEASKCKFICSLTKRKYNLSQISEWFNTPQVRKYTESGYILKYMTKTQEMQNPSKYSKGDLEQIFCLVMIKPYNPNLNVDGIKPISEKMPSTFKEMNMNEAQPAAPDHAVPIDMNDLDDEIPF